MRRASWLTCALLAGTTSLALAAPTAKEVVLPFKGSNKWVAPEDNAGLQELLLQAKGGTTHFWAVLPTDGRPLAVTRLLVLRDLLSKAAGAPVVIEENDGKAAANTLRLQFLPE